MVTFASANVHLQDHLLDLLVRLHAAFAGVGNSVNELPWVYFLLFFGSCASWAIGSGSLQVLGVISRLIRLKLVDGGGKLWEANFDLDQEVDQPGSQIQKTSRILPLGLIKSLKNERKSRKSKPSSLW